VTQLAVFIPVQVFTLTALTAAGTAGSLSVGPTTVSFSVAPTQPGYPDQAVVGISTTGSVTVSPTTGEGGP
jgi:hypothetical protein